MTELLRTVPLTEPDARSIDKIKVGGPPGTVLQSASFRSLMAVKRRVIVPLLGSSLLFTFTVALLAGYAPGVMALRVAGSLTLGYLLVFGVYLVCWVASVIYVALANRAFEALALDLASDHRGDAT